jgi:hypothetical protein
MADEQTPPVGSDNPTPETSAPETPQSGAVHSGAETPKTYDETYVKELRKENATHRTKARELEARLAELENASKAAEDKKLAEQNEWKTLAEKRAAELDAERQKFAQERLDLLRGNVAARYASRLVKPDGEDVDPVAEFAKRLSGSTVDELVADAEKLIKLFGAPAAASADPARSRPTTTPAPDGQPRAGRDDTTRKGEYFGGANTSPMFQGGGVVIRGNTELP